MIYFTSVVRSIEKGNSHGGIYSFDTNTEQVKQVYDHNDQQISWQGHGGDRGLRGIVNYKNNIIASSHNELFFFDDEFTVIKSFKNPNLRNNHSAKINEDILYLTCTNSDCVLMFDLITEKFIEGIRLSWPGRDTFEVFKKPSNHPGSINNLGNDKDYLKYFSYDKFDPRKTIVENSDTVHLNSVSIKDNRIFVSGISQPFLFDVTDTLQIVEQIPCHTHDTQWMDNILIYNDTGNGNCSIGPIRYTIPAFDIAELEYEDIPNDHAIKGFIRGLAFDDGFIYFGCSPMSIIKIDRINNNVIRHSFTKDIRCSISNICITK